MSYRTHLSRVDKVMARLVKRYPLKVIRPAKNPLEELVGSIISQQLSVKAADTIARYIKNVAHAFIAGHLNRAHLMRMSDTEVHRRLIAIKGVGPWTVEMFLIFALGRPDVFSPGDVGLQNAIRVHYGKKPTPAFIKNLSARWAPYRSYACRYLWKSLDNE